MFFLHFHFLALVTRKGVALISTTQHADVSKKIAQYGTECYSSACFMPNTILSWKTKSALHCVSLTFCAIFSFNKTTKHVLPYRFTYDPSFAQHSGLLGTTNALNDTGVLAQEVRRVLPDAVKEAGDVMLPNGDGIPKFLVVNKVYFIWQCRIIPDFEVLKFGFKLLINYYINTTFSFNI